MSQYVLSLDMNVLQKELRVDVFNSIDNTVSPTRSDRASNREQQEGSESKKIQLKKTTTDEQIREKLAARLKDAKVDISKKARNHPGKNSKGVSLNAAPSDIADNDPTNEMTQDKLKKLLEGNGFDFNEKERAALEEILYRS